MTEQRPVIPQASLAVTYSFVAGLGRLPAVSRRTAAALEDQSVAGSYMPLPDPLLVPLEAVAAAARAVVAELEACRDCCGDEHAEPLADALAALDRARQETSQ